MNPNLYALIESRIAADPDAPCMVLEDGATLTYGDIGAGTGRMARRLSDLGVGQRDRLMAQTAKTPEAVMLYLATLKIGAIYVPINTAYTAAEVDYFRGDCEPALFVDDAVALARDSDGLDPLEETAAASADDLAAIIYTSGTTGRSKGAMLTHGGLVANALSLIEAWGYSRDDVVLHALPIYHVHGLFVALHCALFTGGAMLWLEKFDEAAVIDRLSRTTVMMGVPTFYSRLLASPRFTREAAAPPRVYISGSAPLLESVFDEFEARTGKRILERYGMSEALMITSNPLNGERAAGSVGFPLPGVEVRIAGGETGDIQIRGPSVFKGYWRMPEKTASEFTVEGFFITGDVGRLDADGRLWISGRAKDLIITGGFNVYPREIELAVDLLPGVIESAVIGLPHPDFGEAVVAVVAGSGDETGMIGALREGLAGFKTPKRIFFVDDLPRNAMGKVQKAALRERYANIFTT